MILNAIRNIITYEAHALSVSSVECNCSTGLLHVYESNLAVIIIIFTFNFINRQNIEKSLVGVGFVKGKGVWCRYPRQIYFQNLASYFFVLLFSCSLASFLSSLILVSSPLNRSFASFSCFKAALCLFAAADLYSSSSCALLLSL